MFVIHADSWNQADPQKIIDLIPEDIRPYSVLLISLSINNAESTANNGKCIWKRVEDGVATARSWMRVAAANGIWAMIQPSSGGYTHFPDYGPNEDLESTVYGEFFRDYPNFLGFNYAEQFWGFDSACSPSAIARWEHWSNLLKLTNKYGGYLAVSFTGGFWSAAINPLAMVKRNETFANALGKYANNFIIQEKFTSKYGYHDIESVSLGMYLSGFAGHYGIRTDRTGWYNADGSDTYPVRAGSPHLIEHLALTGQTYFDGPELIWLDTVKTLSNGKTSDGYSTRRWEFFPHFKNIHMDIYRKILDGTLRILNRQEVIDRTKVVVVNDVSSGNDRDKYSSPQQLFSGLYLLDDDGTYMDQHSWYKKTGRYPAIPTVWKLTDDLSKSFAIKVNKSAYTTRWPTNDAKTKEFDTLFPQEYTGDIYAGRQENTWITYNPYKTGDKTASGTISFKYNSCTSVELTYAQFTSGVIKEYPDKLTIYLTNYDSEDTSRKNNFIKIRGASSAPTYTYQDRGEHEASTVDSVWADGVLTLSVSHNGPLDITINCTGTASSRLTSYKTASLQAPSAPPAYTGPRQYEAEHFDFKNIAGIVEESSAVNAALRNYQGLGYLNFGTHASASIRDTVTVPTGGSYTLQTRYYTESDVDSVDLYVNGNRVTGLWLPETSSSTWRTNEQSISLNAGTNTIEFRSSSGTRKTALYFDNIVISR